MKKKSKPNKNSKAAKTSIINSLIIHCGRNEICVDSRDIANEFGRQHKNVLRTLAPKRVGCCRGLAHQAFRELEFHGFIKLILEGHFYK